MGSPMAIGGVHVFNEIGVTYPASARGHLLRQCPIPVPVTLVTGFYKHLQVTRLKVSIDSGETPKA
jgi:hypothetical protein